MSNRPVIVKKARKHAGHGHHGGAWKVAYADFVTAMMAFFLLLWLLNVTTDEQKAGIADYFAPASLSRTESGAGKILGGRTLIAEGSRISDMGVPSSVINTNPRPHRGGPDEDMEAAPGTGGDAPAAVEAAMSEEAFEQWQAQREQKVFEETKGALSQAIEEVPELNELKRHLIVDMTPEGLRVQIVDRENQSMFPTGSAQMHERTRLLLQKIAQVVARLPNKLSITGHTDAAPYRSEHGYGNWELSTDRANSSRRVLMEAGLPQKRITQVVGKAEQEPLSADPLDPTNRRIAIVLLREAPLPKAAEAPAAAPPASSPPERKT